LSRDNSTVLPSTPAVFRPAFSSVTRRTLSSALARDRSRSPLFDILVDYHEGDGAGLQPGEGLSELSAKEYDRGEHGVSKYDLTFMFVASGDQTTVLLE